MSKKKMNGDGIYFTGKASDEVTGSQYLVQFGNHKCLLECGLHQSSSNDYLDSYKINSEKFKFKPSEIEFVFVAHPHIDHCGLIPRLVKEGFCGKIIATGKTAAIMKPLLLNSCYIVNEEAKILSRKYKRNYLPLYGEDDVYRALDMISVYDEYNTLIQLTDNICFQWLQNSHCLGAAQLQLILSDNRKTKKIFYTSDIGALFPKNHYLGITEKPEMFNDITIMESTYGNSTRETKKSRIFDVEHLRVAINTTLERGGTVILPCFSFSKTQEMLTTIFDIYSGDASFKTNVVVDSKLSCDICNCYSALLTGDAFEKWESVMRWSNLHLVSEKEDSQICLADNSPKIIISSSGFCTNGRIINYLKNI